MLLNIPREALLNNYIENDTKIIFYPLYFIQILILSPKFIIRDNFIYPIGKRFKITIAFLLAFVFVLYIYSVIYLHDFVEIYKDHRLLALLLSSYGIVNYFETVSLFILNVIHNKNNILLILNIQTLNKDIDIGEKCKMSFLLWNWICYMSIVCMELLMILFNYMYYRTNFADMITEFLNMTFTLNFVYVIRIIILLNIYMMKFHKNILIVENYQGRDNRKKIDIYQKLMEVYTLWRKISHVLVLFCLLFWTRTNKILNLICCIKL